MLEFYTKKNDITDEKRFKVRLLGLLFIGMIIHLFGSVYAAPDKHHIAAINNFILQYQRPITVLEITTQVGEYLSELSTAQKIVGIAWVLPGTTIDLSLVKNCIVLAPPSLHCTMIEEVSRCEHFDVVIVRNIARCIAEPLERLLAALVRLGDALFIEPDTQEFELLLTRSSSIKIVVPRNSASGPLYLYQKSKAVLTKARYTQKGFSEINSYRVSSSFLKKEFSKGLSRKSIPWIPGINLVTFIMLRGIYPTDSQLQEQLKSLMKIAPKHTDLVLGNMILSGEKIIAIDSDQNHKADSRVCLEAALKAFARGNTRLSSPQAFMKAYYQLLR